MSQQCRFGVLLGLLVIGSGCTNREGNGGTTDGPDAGTTDGPDAGTTDGPNAGTTDNPDPGTTDNPDPGTTDNPDAGGEPNWAWEWDPLILDEIVVDQAPVPRPTPGRWPVAAFDASQYLVVWEDHRARRPILYGGRVAADGTALDPFGFPILDVVPAAELSADYYPSVAFDGVNFLIVTYVYEQIFGVRVSPAGEVLDPGGILIADEVGWGARPSLAFDGEQFLVAWSDGDIYRARVKPDGTLLDPGGVLTYPLNTEGSRVGVSFDGANHLLSWVDYDVQTRVLNAGRIAPDGTVLDETPILSQTFASLNNRLSPVAGFDGTNHVIAWEAEIQNEQGADEYQILACRVTPEGVSLDPDGILIYTDSFESAEPHRLSIAAGNGRSDVVWTLGLRIRGTRIATDGTTTVHPEDAFPIGLEASLAIDPNGALLLWRDGEDRSDDHPAITGTLLDGAGLPVPGSVVAPASPASRQDVKAVASDGQNFFVLWADTRDPMSDGKALYGALVGADGAPLGPEPIHFGTEAADLADVVFDGANFVITWVNEYDVHFHVVRVSPAGVPLDMVPLQAPLCLQDPYDRTLAAASDGTHTLLVGAASGSWQNELAAVLLDQQGSVISDVVSILEYDQGYGQWPAVSFDGLGYLVVWSEPQKGIFGQRMTQAGGLDGPRIAVVENDVITHVATAAGGGMHLVVWEDESGIWATRVSSDGQVLDPDGYLVDASEFGLNGCWNPDLSIGSCASVDFDGENFIVAWRAQSIPGDASSLDLYAAKLNPAGEVSSHVAISQGPEREGRPFLAVGDGRVIVAFAQFVPHPPYDTRRAVTRLIVP